MKTKILIAVLSIGLFSTSTLKAQRTKQTHIKYEQIGVTYTCPMHADVKSDKPGTCPKCGMELKKMDMSSTKMDMEMDSTKMEMKNGTMMMDHSKMDMNMDSTKMEMKDNSMMMDHSKMEMKPVYTCSMHPEIISDKKGECTKCGMHLIEKKMDMKKAEDTPENKNEHKNHKH
ncbi:MAG: heavy metal-binding domain-containing protein [Lutibacter sp.]